MKLHLSNLLIKINTRNIEHENELVNYSLNIKFIVIKEQL